MRPRIVPSTFSRKKPGTCAWFLLCYEKAVGTVRHPILGSVPVCERCATKHGLVIEGSARG